MTTHDFIHPVFIGFFYFYLFYNFSAGPMAPTSYYAILMVVLSLLFAVTATLFKTKITTSIRHMVFWSYKLYFYSKL